MSDRDTTPDANPTGDPLIEKAESQDSSRAADLLDVRRFIAGLLGIYGVILTIMGLGASDAEIAKAADTNINLLTGIALLITAAVFVAWSLWRPLSRELEDAA
jgi:hypothetical protein